MYSACWAWARASVRCGGRAFLHARLKASVRTLESLAAQARPAFDRGAVIRTLLSDVPPESITGSVLFHEHLSIRYPLTKALAEEQGRPVPPSFSDDVDLMVEETKAAAKEGIACFVDGGRPDMDRDLAALTRTIEGNTRAGRR